MYSTVLTQIGMAQLINSQITGTTLKWSKMGVGDGNGLPIVVDSNRTALVNERYRAGINHLYRDTQDPTQIIAELVMMPEEGGYTIREVGIYDTDDNLVVYGSLPEVVKPVLAEGSGITLTVRCRAAIGNAASVRLIIDPSTVMATRKYVNDELTAHSEATDAHPLASASRPGFMSAADKMAVDKSFRGIKVGNSILYPSGEHQYAELVPESPVILTPDPATGKITVAVNASVTAKVGAVPVADGNGMIIDWIVQSIALTMPGHIKLRSGLIVQWGKTYASQNNPKTITFPLPFTGTTTFSCFANHPGEGDARVNAFGRTNTTMSLHVHYEIAPAQDILINWFAIGH